jgi:hypothetical protein
MGIAISPGSYLSKNACFFSSTLSSSSGKIDVFFFSEAVWRALVSGLVGTVLKPSIERRGLSYGIVGFEKTGVGGIGVSMVLVVEAFESGAEGSGEVDISCLG